MVKAMGPFRDSRAPSWLSGPRTDVYRLNPPSHRPFTGRPGREYETSLFFVYGNYRSFGSHVFLHYDQMIYFLK